MCYKKNKWESVRKDRQDGYGGVLLAMRIGMEFSVLETQATELVCIKSKIDNSTSIIVGALYRSPNSDLDYANKMCTEIENIVKANKNLIIWIGGDLNLPDIIWSCILSPEIKT